MSKNLYDLIVGLVTAAEVAADAIFVYLGATGKMDLKTATAWGGSVTIIGNAALGVCARFIKEDVKKVAKK